MQNRERNKSRFRKIYCCTANPLFIYFLLSVSLANAQNKPQKETYITLKAGPSFLFTAAKKGTEQISFPYSVKPSFTGIISDTTFVSNKFAPLKNMQTAIYFTIEAGNKNHFFELNFGGFTSADNGAFISLGYGHNFYISVFEKHVENPTQRNFVLKPSLHIAYNSFANEIGNLDNLNKYIYIGSFTSEPTFKESDIGSDGITSTTTTYNTKNLGIEYLQRSFLLSPQIAFGSNQYKHIFHWEIIVGAYLSLTESIKAKFKQEATDDVHSTSSIYNIGTNGIAATFNGNNITNAPFKFSGFKIGFNIGITKKNLKKIKANYNTGL